MLFFKDMMRMASMYLSTFLGMILFMLVVGMYGYACRICIWGVPHEYVENHPVHNHRDAIVHPMDA